MKNQLLERTGHSYSGISDIVFNNPEHISELLLQIDENYNDLKNKQQELEKQLEKVKNERACMISDFIYLHQAMKLNDEPISFIKDGFYTEIKVISREERKINYEKKKITHEMRS